MRYVVHFSCGAASAVAAKLMVSEWKQSLCYPIGKPLIVNAFVEEEHADNRRFLADVAAWISGNEKPWPILVLRNEKYNASTREVWRRKRYMKGRAGAPCAQELKRKVLGTIARPGDVGCIGYTIEEEDRAADIEEMFPSEQFRFPLIEERLSKADCLAMVERAGIRLPAMYLLGYDNANCIGCVKGGEGYWDKIRRDFPNRFNEIVQIQEGIGPGAYLFRDRKTGVRFGLKDLPVGAGRYQDEPEISCSFFCQMAEDKMNA